MLEGGLDITVEATQKQKRGKTQGVCGRKIFFGKIC